MILMVEQGIRGGICNSVYRFAKANKKYMKNYDKYKESSYLNFLDVSNLNGLAMPQNLPTFNFKWVKDTPQFNEHFKKNYNQKSEEEYILKVDKQYPEKFYYLHNDLPFLSERKKLKKFEKLGTNLHDKTANIIHMRSLKQKSS